jgi:large subunit ribosomal protein L25
MEKTVLPVELREARGKGAAHALRREGLIPGIIYGPQREPAMIKVDPKRLRTLLDAAGAENLPFQVAVDGGAPFTVMLKELQREPVSRRPLHADFWELTKGQKLHVEVAIRVTGTAAGVAKGGVVSLVMRDLPVECLPEDIPEHIDIDVSALDIGHSIHVRDLELARNLKPTVDPDQTVVTCAPPTVAKEEAAPAAAEAVESEEAAKKEEEKS